MSLNPSNLIAARANPGRTMFPNLAGGPKGQDRTDETVKTELEAAGIKPVGPYEYLRANEVPTAYAGEHCMWLFKPQAPACPPTRPKSFTRPGALRCEWKAIAAAHHR